MEGNSACYTDVTVSHCPEQSFSSASTSTTAKKQVAQRKARARSQDIKWTISAALWLVLQVAVKPIFLGANAAGQLSPPGS